MPKSACGIETYVTGSIQPKMDRQRLSLPPYVSWCLAQAGCVLLYVIPACTWNSFSLLENPRIHMQVPGMYAIQRLYPRILGQRFCSTPFRDVLLCYLEIVGHVDRVWLYNIPGCTRLPSIPAFPSNTRLSEVRVFITHSYMMNSQLRHSGLYP